MTPGPFDDRDKSFTDAEFKALTRNGDGDVIDLAECFMWITPAQIERLTGDDQSRVDDYEEEVRCLMAEFQQYG